MLRFYIKGLFRDRSRSLMPILVVAIGVTLVVLMQCWVTGVLGDMIVFNARFATGHVKVMSQAYSENMDQTPNDLALLGTDRYPAGPGRRITREWNGPNESSSGDWWMHRMRTGRPVPRAREEEWPLTCFLLAAKRSND